MSMPRVSVVMPVYNTERFVAEAIDSVLAQTFTDFEFIIIDDGSTDGSLAILRMYEERDARIRVVSRPNTGNVVAANEGVDLSRGALMARLDADDRIMPELLEQQVARFDAEPDLVLLGANARVMDESGVVFGDFTVPETHEAIEASHLKGDMAVHHPGAMMRVAQVRAVGKYRPQFKICEDYDLWLRLGEVGRLANLPGVMMHKRMLPGSAIVSGIAERDRTVERALDEALLRRGLPSRTEPIRSLIRSRADYYRQWAWMALRASQKRMARRYAWGALRSDPMRAKNWILLACVLRGH